MYITTQTDTCTKKQLHLYDIYPIVSEPYSHNKADKF